MASTMPGAMRASSTTKAVVGIVGGIGAGKSTAAREFGRLGCEVIDADAIGHALLGEEGVRDELRQRWGERIFDANGAVDRRRLGKLVFEGATELEALNEIMHPRIRRRMEGQIADAGCNPGVRAIILDAAVLFEAAWDDLCTHVVFVYAPGVTRAERVAHQRGWSIEKWARREKLQISLDIKAGKCDYTVDGSSDVSRLRGQVREVFHRIVGDVDRP